jgi:hypothetical protein
MGKLIIFIIFLFTVIIYPLLMDTKYKTKNIYIKPLPEIEIEKGKFFIYNRLLEKYGDFYKLILKDNNYIITDLNFNNLVKQEYFFSKKVTTKGDVINGENTIYKNKDFIIKAKYASYNRLYRIISGREFVITSATYKGYGKGFVIDKNKNIYATKIDFNLKVE